MAIKVVLDLSLCLGSRFLAEFLQEINQLKGTLTSTEASSLVSFNSLGSGICVEGSSQLIDLLYKFFHNCNVLYVMRVLLSFWRPKTSLEAELTMQM